MLRRTRSLRNWSVQTQNETIVVNFFLDGFYYSLSLVAAHTPQHVFRCYFVLIYLLQSKDPFCSADVAGNKAHCSTTRCGDKGLFFQKPLQRINAVSIIHCWQNLEVGDQMHERRIQGLVRQVVGNAHAPPDAKGKLMQVA